MYCLSPSDIISVIFLTRQGLQTNKNNTYTVKLLYLKHGYVALFDIPKYYISILSTSTLQCSTDLG